MIYHSWARVSPPTTSKEVPHPPWTKSDLLTLPRKWFRTETIILSPFLTLEKSVCAGAFENRTCCRHDKYAKLSHRREHSGCHLTSLSEVHQDENCGSGVTQSSHRRLFGPPPKPKKVAGGGWLEGPNLTFDKTLSVLSGYGGSSALKKTKANSQIKGGGHPRGLQMPK